MMQVNIDSATRQALKQAFESEDHGMTDEQIRGHFSNAGSEIIKLMAFDTVMRFRQADGIKVSLCSPTLSPTHAALPKQSVLGLESGMGLASTMEGQAAPADRATPPKQGAISPPG